MSSKLKTKKESLEKRLRREAEKITCDIIFDHLHGGYIAEAAIYNIGNKIFSTHSKFLFEYEIYDAKYNTGMFQALLRFGHLGALIKAEVGKNKNTEPYFSILRDILREKYKKYKATQEYKDKCFEVLYEKLVDVINHIEEVSGIGITSEMINRACNEYKVNKILADTKE